MHMRFSKRGLSDVERKHGQNKHKDWTWYRLARNCISTERLSLADGICSRLAEKARCVEACKGLVASKIAKSARGVEGGLALPLHILTRGTRRACSTYRVTGQRAITQKVSCAILSAIFAGFAQGVLRNRAVADKEAPSLPCKAPSGTS